MSTNGKTVLLVEDNEDNRIVYSTILQHFGYKVMEALNGEEGIAKARAVAGAQGRQRALPQQLAHFLPTRLLVPGPRQTHNFLFRVFSK